jgi:hypothetical protein
MSTAEKIAFASVCIAGLSAFIAGLAFLKGWRASRKADEAMREANDVARQNLAVQERLAQIEQSRERDRLMQALQADLRAELRQTDRGGHRLVIANAGQGTARNLAITLDGKPLAEHPASSGNKNETTLIGPRSEVSCVLGLTRGCRPPFEFQATWDDDSGQQGRFSTTLTL